MKIDWTKPIETTDGQPCVYLGTFGDEYVWVAYSSDERKSWGTIQVFSDGYVRVLDSRIRNVADKRKLEGWLNVYGIDEKYLSAHYYDRKTDADEALDPGGSIRIACIRIDQEYTIGEAGDD